VERVERIDRWQCRRQPLFLVFFYEGRHRGCDNEFVSAATPSGLAPLPVTDRRRHRGPGCGRLARCDHDGCHFRLLGSRYCVFAILSLRGFYSVRPVSPFSVGRRGQKECPFSGVAVAPARRWQRKITDRNPSQPPPLFTQLPGGALPATNTRPTGPYHFCLGLEGGPAGPKVVGLDYSVPFGHCVCQSSLPCLRHSSGLRDVARPQTSPKEGLWSLLSEPCLA
jgi:hypothetical protein